MQIDLREAAQHLEDLVRAAQRGEQVVILAPDGPVRLEPVKGPTVEPRAPAFGFARGTVRMSDDFDAPLPDFDAYMP